MKPKTLGKYLLRYSPSLKYVAGNHLPLRISVDGTLVPVQDIQYPYICPMCLRNIFGYHNAGIHYSAEFTEDHYPPECVAGRRKMLVCKPCNSKFGITHDWAIKEYLEAMSFLKGDINAELPVRSVFEGTTGSYKLNLSNADKNIIMHHYSSKKYPLVEQWLKKMQTNSDWKIDVTFTVPDEALVKKALLRSAYLYCFSYFGYGFAFSYVAKHLRHVIAGEEPHTLSNFGVFLYDDRISLPAGLHFLHTPKEYSCYVVNMSLHLKKSKHNCTASVLIPLGSEKDSTSLQVFQDVVDNKHAVTGNFTPVLEHLLVDGNFDAYNTTKKET